MRANNQWGGTKTPLIKVSLYIKLSCFWNLLIKGIVWKHLFDFLLFTLYDYQVVLDSSHSVENIVK
ncbi:hypothetical protein CN491_12350 [Bacillus cereus]|uniref:Uncharacterized protein n=1 Tax=Bacillus cereus TaxID=1396 RepID=A0A2A8LP86_BACCE|nr:hypothetical protein CN491_12350 [Bacillus cereus]PFP72562.1 hypothetical protein COJ95_23100 [Bacillus cereus]PGT16986.1 hypothetical protein COC96_17595 [Bacillus cereus]